MARKPLQIEINGDTPQKDLEFCAIAAERTSDINIQRKAAEAKAELTRRERKFQTEMFNAQSRERVKAQKFQMVQSKRGKEEKVVGMDSDPRKVMVIYGRNDNLRSSMFEFLRSLDLNPIEWEQAVSETGSASPHTLDVVIKAFEMAMAVVVLMTGDDQARLHPELVTVDDPDYETKFSPQPRANVLFEAGMALALQRKRTVPVTIGKIRQMSNIDGLNLVKLDNTAKKRNALATRLKNAGCQVNQVGNDWLEAGNFDVSSAAPNDSLEGNDQEPAHDFSEEETSILTLLFENGEMSEDDMAGLTGLRMGKVEFYCNELFNKKVIFQTVAGSSHGEDQFTIRPGQVDLLRRVGVLK